MISHDVNQPKRFHPMTQLLFAANLIRQPVSVNYTDLRHMVKLVAELFALSRLPAYREYISSKLPYIARMDPGHDAVMMGYDFHLTPEGPRLIEVNTNAGGGVIAYVSHLGEDGLQSSHLPERLNRQVLNSFLDEWWRYRGDRACWPKRILIVDERPTDQFLYPEMQAFQQLFEGWGISCAITEPQDIEEKDGELFHQGQKVEMIYNRHCDFYLETPPMAAIGKAYQSGSVCLTPNPFTYGLLGDKRRMILWSSPEELSRFGLKPATAEHILTLVPWTRLLSFLDLNETWQTRKNLVFKPATRFGSRGVYMGTSISRSRFDSLPAEQTLVQALVPPSLTFLPHSGQEMKTDFRLFAYRNRPLGLAARLYRGQVTNLQSEGSGFAPVRIQRS
jgi:hypothetical protein